MTSCEMREKCKMDEWDLMVYILAAACHDVEHPGYNNMYLIETKQQLSLRYNDSSVLENHHAATAFAVMHQDHGKYNIFESFSKD